jgi:hypothetical protein
MPPEPIWDATYWRRRLELAQAGHLHHSVFRCPLDRWLAIEAKHREILARTINPTDSILDAGCGWGLAGRVSGRGPVTRLRGVGAPAIPGAAVHGG